MNYYQFHIGDYRSATMHLTDEEDLAYRRLLDMYYDSEQPIPRETQWVSRRLRVGCEVVNRVLQDFFVECEKGWKHLRCDMEIAGYRDIVARNQRNGKLGGRPRKTQSVTSRNPVVTLTSNQEPVTSNQKPKEKTFSPDSDEVRLSKMLFSFIEKRNPKNKEPNMQTWARNVDLMIRVDGRLPEDIERVIRWCQSDNFWQNNILSTGKLREKFDALILKAGGSSSKAKQTTIVSAGGVKYEF